MTEHEKIFSQQKNKLIFTNLLGTLLELYDISIYGYFASYIASNFFPNQSHTQALLSTFAIFFISFIVRPIGSLFWGYLGDTVGRKTTLLATIIMMTIATCGIGLLPTASQIGYMAPVLLILCRIFQGLSFSGEFIGSLLFLLEQAPASRRAFVASWSTCGGNAGLLLASVVCWLVSHFCTSAELLAWGWRIPFLLASLGGALSLYLRSQVQETQQFKQAAAHTFPLRQVFSQHKRDMLRLLSLSCFYMVACYLIYVWSSTALVYISHLSTSRALGVTSLSLILQVLLIPYIAAWSDLIGKKPLLTFGIVGLALFIYPYFLLLQSASFGIILLAQLIIACIAAFFTSLTPIYISELIPEKMRFSGVALGYNVAGAITGGSTLWVATQLVHLPHGLILLSSYFILWAAVALMAVLSQTFSFARPLVLLTE